MFSKKMFAIVGAGALVLGIAGTAAATATTTAPPKAPFHACASVSSVLKLAVVNAAGRLACPKNSRLVILGATGAKGPAGASIVGPQGPAGATGATGPVGASVVGPQGPAGVSPTFGPVTLYDSTTPAGIYSQAFNGPQVSEFGNAVNLASNPAGAALGIVTVDLVNFGPSSFTTPITVTLYGITAGGIVGAQLATMTESVSVPGLASPTVFEAAFDFTGQAVVLPSVVVYGITLDQLATDCAADASTCGNDPNPIGSLNVALNANVSAGSDVYPGDVYVASSQADAAGTALASDLGACPGAPVGILSTFQGVPVGCANGYGAQTESPYIPGGLGIDTIPAVSFTTAP